MKAIGSRTSHGLAWALLLAACGQGEPSPTAAPLEPPPAPHAVAGLPGFASKSTIVFHAAPETPHLLDVAYLFPQRARWWRGLGEGTQTRRIQLYRYGQHAFEISEGSTRSVEKHGRERALIFLQMELRRAWMMWPDGFEWRGEGPVKMASVEDVGTLRARLDKHDNLVEIASLATDGVLLEGYGLITWQEHRGRRFPRSAEFSYRGQPIWSETVESVETAVQWLDRYFLPVDRIELGESWHPEHTLELEAPPTVVRRIALERARDWVSRVAEAREVHAEQGPRLGAQGFEIDPAIVLQLDSHGRATHVLLRLAPSVQDPPAGWEVRPGGPFVSRVLARPQDLPQAIAALQRDVAPGQEPGVAQARLRDDGQIQLIVPVL